jgi:SAM-dependent methyltransferase
MDSALRRAWTEVVTAEDYEIHMAAIGQAQAAAELTRYLVESAALRAGSRITIAGAGTGQMLDYLAPTIFRRYRLTCSDLNPIFLLCLRGRLARHGLDAEVLEDDIERTRLAPGPDLLMATLLLEHIDWRPGVEVFARLRPKTCGIIVQENPPDMAAAVTPGRPLPPSIARALESAHPTLVPRDQLIAAMAAQGYPCRESAVREVADGKRLVGLLFAGPRYGH